MFRENKYVYARLSTYLLYNVIEVCWGVKGTGINNVLGVYLGMIKATVLM